MAQKLLQEVMQDIKLAEKKLKKSLKTFRDTSVITHVDRPTIGYPDNDKNAKFNRDLAASKMKAELQSYKDLVKNLAHLKRVRDVANMNTKLPISYFGRELTIYDAIQLKRSISQHMTNLYESIETSKHNATRDSSKIYTNRVISGSKSSDKTDLELYPLLPIKELEEEAKDFDRMMSELDAKITIANSTTMVEV